MAIDEDENYYLTGTGGIWCVRRNGEAIGFIPVPEFVSNVCFGGPDGKWLFATCQNVVYRLKMKVGGHFVGPLNRWNHAGRSLPKLLQHSSYQSSSMNTEVGYSYWLPPQYKTDQAQRYPVLYWLHGLGGNEIGDDYPVSVISERVQSGKIPPMILVQVNAGARSVYADSWDREWLAETTIIQELLPHIDGKFRTRPDRSGRAIQGMSMGGEGAIRFALKYPNLFSSAIGYAGGYVSHSVLKRYRPRIFREMFNDNPEHFEKFMTHSYIPTEQVDPSIVFPKIRLICGTADDSISLQRQIADRCLKANVPVEVIEIPGIGHDCRALAERPDSDDIEYAVSGFSNVQ